MINANIGDKLIVHGFDRRSVVTVAKIGKTRMTMEGGQQFMRSNGRAVGSQSTTPFVSLPDDGEVEQVEVEMLRRLVSIISKVEWNKMNNDDLLAVVQLLTIQKTDLPPNFVIEAMSERNG